MKRVWNQKKIDYLKQIYAGKSRQEIADLINKKFNTSITKSAVSSKLAILGLKTNYKYIRKFSEEIVNYIKENHKGKSTIELAAEVSKKFNIDCDSDCLQNLKSRIKRKENFKFSPARNDGCIKKGHIPANKGKKWDDYMPKEKQEQCRKTTYKKGDKPLNAVDVGTEHMRYSGSKPDDLGYLYIKTADGKGNKNWRPKQVVIYEQHYGPIPKNHKVIFADGNRFNFDINNLILVSNSEQLIMNQKQLIKDNAELTKTGSLIAKVIDKSNKLKRKGKK